MGKEAPSESVPPQGHPVFGEGRFKNWQSWWWEGKVTVCFAGLSDGWCTLVLVSSVYNQSHHVFMSNIGAPFHDLVDWLGEIVDDRLPATVLIDEEGVHSKLTVLAYDEQWLEFRAGRPKDPVAQSDGSWVDAPEEAASFGVVCRVRKHEFLAEWSRRIHDFLRHDYRAMDWEPTPWSEYEQHDFDYPRWCDLHRLDLRKIDRWVAENRRRTRTCPQILFSGSEKYASEGRQWAARHHRALIPQGYKPMEIQSLGSGETQQLAIAVINRKFKIKHAVRDCDAVLILSQTGELTLDARIAALYASRLKRPLLELHAQMDWKQASAAWLDSTEVERLNFVIDLPEVPSGSEPLFESVCRFLESWGG